MVVKDRTKIVERLRAGITQKHIDFVKNEIDEIMAKKVKYTVVESTHSHWNDNKRIKEPKFQLLKDGELICELESSRFMENVVRQRFNEMAERFNEQPFKVDLGNS